ncbi:hypothetical protein F5144DRAFT_623148 [Chaetomium tenue]|uniref:Uncharacterized protein n=1 Tax=Chaetomium tenue TaxID=1854479 RepID=A0ACB7NZQ2_9PEZI|nr:hypothetical protein F5144DRAFT_623148 [Chaetomium globosum]
MVMNMQTSPLAAALLVAGVACEDTAQEPVFRYPPDGSKYTYHRMDTVIVNYTVFHDTAELSTFCDPGHATLSESPQNLANPIGQQHANDAPVHWQTVPGSSDSIPILLNFASDERCWFDLRAGPDGINSKSSASFRILSDERSKGPQTFGVDTDPPTPSTPSATSSTSPHSSTATSTETPSSAPEDGGGGGGGLKGGALYVVSFCSGIGGAILILLGFRLWWKWECWREERKRKVALAEAHERLKQVRELRNAQSGSGNRNMTVAEARERVRKARYGDGNGGSGGRGIGVDGDAAPRLDVDVLEWRRPGGGSGTAEGGGARGERRDEPDGVAGAV